jgi:ApbE superfamily uncharacterized protein (UPF0280 family)
MYPETYRSLVTCKDLVSFNLVVKETNLYVSTGKNLKSKTQRLVQKYRSHLESYIERYPDFRTSLTPLPLNENAPLIVKAMLEAGEKAGVGPMASVAGAIAEFVGRELMSFSTEVIIENGGDIFMVSRLLRIIGIYAGASPFGGKIGLEIAPDNTPIGVCTSSGMVGHSLSLGKADAAVLLSQSATLADAAATAVGNIVHTTEDIPRGLEKAQQIEGITGVLIIKDDKMGSWGNIKLCRTQLAVGH